MDMTTPKYAFPKKYLNAEESLKIAGEFGPFQWTLTGIFCLMNVPVITQIYIMYFVSFEPTWKCVDNSTNCTLNGTFTSDNELRCQIPRDQWVFTESNQYSIVTEYDIYCDSAWMLYMTTSLYFIGHVFGSVFFGWMADSYGRKKVLFPAETAFLVFSLLCGFMPNMGWLVFGRFVVGFLAGCVDNQTYILQSELVSTKYRPTATSIFYFAWTGTLCLVGLKAYLIKDWKILFVVSTVPYFIVLFSYKFVPESVRWLRLMGRLDEAKDVYKQMARWNKKEMDDTAEMTLLTKKVRMPSPLDLFKTKKIAKISLVIGFMYMITNMVYYGLSLAADDLGGSLYLDFVFLSMAELPAGVLSMYLPHKFGRKRSTFCSTFLAGLFCIAVAFMPQSGSWNTVRITSGIFGKLFATLSYDVIIIWSLELFPTGIRSLGSGFLGITGGIGSATSPWIAQGLKTLHVSLPFIVMGIMSLISAATSLVLPETKGKEMLDTEEEEY